MLRPYRLIQIYLFLIGKNIKTKFFFDYAMPPTAEFQTLTSTKTTNNTIKKILEC